MVNPYQPEGALPEAPGPTGAQGPMVTPRRIAVLLALPLIFMVERAAYYGVRSVLMLHLIGADGRGLGMERSEASALYSTLTVGVTLSPLLGGALAIGTGPRIPLMAGSILAAVGYLLLSSGTAASLTAAMVLIALGQGLLKPSVFAIAGQEFGRDLDNARAALCFVLYAAINIGALVSAPIAGVLAKSQGFTAVFATGALVMFLVLGLSAGLSGILQWSGKRPEPAAKTIRAELGAVIVLAAAAPAFVAMTALGDLQFEAFDSGGGTSVEWLLAVNPAVLIVTSLVGIAAILVVSLVLRRKVPVLHGIAAGLLLFSLGTAVMLVGGKPLSVGAAAAGTAIAAVGEALVLPLGLARVLGGSSHRWTSLVAALWLMASGIVTWLTSVLFGAAPRVPAAIALAGCLMTGIALAVLAKTLSKSLFDA